MSENKVAVAPDESAPWLRFVGIAGKSFTIIFLLAFLLYVATVLWIHHQWAGKAVAISQAVGAPADVERTLQGLLPWLLSFALVPAFLRLLAEALNPFRKVGTAVYRLVITLVLSIMMVTLPHIIRSLRGVDAEGLPRVMQPSDPVAAQWFDPDGNATLFWSREEDKSLRFWSRPGFTPDTGVVSQRVTPTLRKEWQAVINRREESNREQHLLEQENLAAKKSRDEPSETGGTGKQSQPFAPGWTLLGNEDGYNWFTPAATDKDTEWFKIEGYNTTYRVKSWCVMRFKKSNGDMASFKVDPSNGVKYHEKATEGEFETVPWPIEEYTAFGMKATHVAFKPLNHEPLSIKIGRAPAFTSH